MAQGKSGKIDYMHIIGEESKAANWAMSHIFFIVSVLVAFCILLFINEEAQMLHRILVIVPPVFFGPALLVRLLWRDRCYRIELNTDDEKIRFFRFFHKDSVEAPIRMVEFRFDRTGLIGISQLVCVVNNARFTIGLEHMFQLAEVLPRGVDIIYADGFWGRLAKKQCEKWSHDH